MAKSNSKKINMFMEHIYNKKQFKLSNLFQYLKHRKAVKKFKKDISNGSPSFYVLWQMADFIKLAESVFFYKNTQKDSEFGLYSSRNYAAGSNGFRVTDVENGLRVTIKLFNETVQLLLEIEYIGSDHPKEYLSFEDNDWENAHNIYDEMLLEQIIKSINHNILRLFDSCYDKR
jgi:hypothetical protein